MKRILVPTDFSPVAHEAFKFAEQLVKATNGELILLHVIDITIAYASDLDAFDYSMDPALIKGMQDEANELFRKWKRKYQGNPEKLSFHVQMGQTTPTILNFAKRQKIDLIVMGTHGASGAKEYFIGSNTEKIVRFANSPVMAIHKSVKLNSVKNIIFPTQLLLNETQLVKQVKKLQHFFNAKLHVTYVNTPVNFKRDRDLKKMLNDYASHYSFEKVDTHIVNDTYEQQGIIYLSNELPGALIAMGTHSRRGLAHFFNPSVTEEVVNHVKCPIWTFSVRKLKA